MSFSHVVFASTHIFTGCFTKTKMSLLSLGSDKDAHLLKLVFLLLLLHTKEYQRGELMNYTIPFTAGDVHRALMAALISLASNVSHAVAKMCSWLNAYGLAASSKHFLLKLSTTFL